MAVWQSLDMFTKGNVQKTKVLSMQSHIFCTPPSAYCQILHNFIVFYPKSAAEKIRNEYKKRLMIKCIQVNTIVNPTYGIVL